MNDAALLGEGPEFVVNAEKVRDQDSAKAGTQNFLYHRPRKYLPDQATKLRFHAQSAEFVAQ